jgi:hypothetical protein
VSIEITLYPPAAKRDEIVAFLKARGYRPCSHLWDWPAGTVNLHWFETSDFTSFDGVEASVFPPSDQEQAQYGSSYWAMHTRTRASASEGDRHEQNEAIRLVRRKFKGDFYNDWYGKNRYTPVDITDRSPIARGLYLIREHAVHNLRAVRFALPNPNPSMQNLLGTKLETLAQADPARVLYNALVPFPLAALEHFFGQAFRVLLRHDSKAQQRLRSQDGRKVDFPDALALADRTSSIEDIVANWYSFQSIDGIHKAFNDWFGIDVWKLFRQRRKLGKKVGWLEKRFSTLIDFRHAIIHRFEVNPDFTKENLEELIDLSILLIETFVDHVEQSRGEKVRDGLSTTS